jgi:hypothetical protein
MSAAEAAALRHALRVIADLASRPTAAPGMRLESIRIEAEAALSVADRINPMTTHVPQTYRKAMCGAALNPEDPNVPVAKLSEATCKECVAACCFELPCGHTVVTASRDAHAWGETNECPVCARLTPEDER